MKTHNVSFHAEIKKEQQQYLVAKSALWEAMFVLKCEQMYI